MSSVVYKMKRGMSDRQIIEALSEVRPITDAKGLQPDDHIIFLGAQKQIIKARAQQYKPGVLFASTRDDIWLLDFSVDKRECWVALGINMAAFQGEDRAEIQQAVAELMSVFKQEPWFIMAVAGISDEKGTEDNILLLSQRVLTEEERKVIPEEHSGFEVRVVIAGKPKKG